MEFSFVEPHTHTVSFIFEKKNCVNYYYALVRDSNVFVMMYVTCLIHFRINFMVICIKSSFVFVIVILVDFRVLDFGFRCLLSCLV